MEGWHRNMEGWHKNFVGQMVELCDLGFCFSLMLSESSCLKEALVCPSLRVSL